MILSSKVLKL